jgi:hypothetical protein
MDSRVAYPLNGDVYLAAIRLPPSPQRERLLDELVRDARWKAYAEFSRGETAGIQAGMQMWMGRAK